MIQTDKPLHNQVVLFTGKLAAAPRHRAQQWVESNGGHYTQSVSKRTTLVVVGMLGWSVLPDGSISKCLEKAEQYMRQGQNIRIISEVVFLEMLGHIPAIKNQSGSMDVKSAAKLLNLDIEHLRRWEQFGLVRFDQDSVSFQELVSLRNIAQMLQQGLNIKAISKTLQAMQRFLPELERPLSQARLLQSHGRTLIVEIQGVKMNTSGQTLFDFEQKAHIENSIPAELLKDKKSNLESLWRQAQQQMQTNNLTGAAQTYKQITTAFPEHWDALLELGNILRLQHAYTEASHCYQQYLQQHQENALCWYNLGYCLDEVGEYQQAIKTFINAIELDNDFTDAVFNTARCYERLHRHQDAIPYWKRYLQLDPNSEWSKIAKRFLHYG